ncbi:glycosyltransferase family 87 protein [Aggregatilineales bacterium SYSU G02658]
MSALQRLPATKLSSVLMALALILLLLGVVYTFFPITNDYYYYFRPVAENWLAGEQSMAGNDGRVLRYPPWTLLFVVLPMGLPDYRLGNALLTTSSLMFVGLSLSLLLRLFPAPRVALIFALCTMFMAEMLFMGQLDAVTLLGMVTAWWALRHQQPWHLGLAFCLLGMKPVNVIPFGVVVLMELRHWPLKAALQSFILPLGMIVLSTLIIGPSFFTTYLGQTGSAATDLAITIWLAADALGLPTAPFVLAGLTALGAALWLAWREGLTERVGAIVMATTLSFTIYAHADYYVLLIPAYLYVWKRNWGVALLIYSLTFTPLLRAPFGRDISWISVAFPLALLVAVWLLKAHPSEQSAPSHPQQLPAR